MVLQLGAAHLNCYVMCLCVSGISKYSAGCWIRVIVDDFLNGR